MKSAPPRTPFSFADSGLFLSGHNDSALLTVADDRLLFIYRNDGKTSRIPIRRHARRLIDPG